MIVDCNTNVYISIDILVILVLNMCNVIPNVFAGLGILGILVLKLLKSKTFNYLVQTTKKCCYTSYILAYKTSNRRVCSISSGNEGLDNSVIGNIELDTHADTIVAGANCCIMSYTGRICDVLPYSDE